VDSLPCTRDGQVIYTPPSKHRCAPGWEWKASVSGGLLPLPPGTLVGVSPDPYRFPAGTLWRCDCGVVWVSTGSPAANMPGVCGWRREGWFARWRRQRREAGRA